MNEVDTRASGCSCGDVVESDGGWDKRNKKGKVEGSYGQSSVLNFLNFKQMSKVGHFLLKLSVKKVQLG